VGRLGHAVAPAHDILARSVSADDQQTAEVEPSGETKTCPQCAETVQAAAKVCRFCDYRFEGNGPAKPRSNLATIGYVLVGIFPLCAAISLLGTQLAYADRVPPQWLTTLVLAGMAASGVGLVVGIIVLARGSTRAGMAIAATAIGLPLLYIVVTVGLVGGP
jgi:uncharacterized protein UPF0547